MIKYILTIVLIVGLFSCRGIVRNDSFSDDEEIQERIDTYEITVSKSAKIPSDGSGPIAGIKEYSNPDTVITFTGLDERFFVPNGMEVNFIYDGIDPDNTYIMYESWIDGYYLTIKDRYDGVNVKFNKLCQIFIVGNPSLTRISVPITMKYEQIIWTPRSDGTWELRIGSTERGCKSKSLDELQKMRNRNYESNIPK